MKSLAQLDIFNRERTIGKKGTPMNERADLIKYFHDRARNREGKQYPVAFIGMKLAHLDLNALYYMKSVLESETKRGATWGKVFWGMLKV